MIVIWVVSPLPGQTTFAISVLASDMSFTAFLPNSVWPRTPRDRAIKPKSTKTLYSNPKSSRYVNSMTAAKAAVSDTNHKMLFNVLFIICLAGPEGIEPTTCGFGDRRSAN